MIRRDLVHGVEELVNVWTHGFGLVASILAFPLLVVAASRAGDQLVLLGVVVFGVTLVAAYAASTMYHSAPPGSRRDLWRRLDQVAVYLLIAGTYTPFSLGVLRGPLGWLLLGTVWLVALIGIAVKIGLRAHAPRLETVTYLCMGWLVVIAIEPLVSRMGWAGFAWLLAGGLAYTTGVGFLVCQSRLRFGHCAWHVATLAGSTCHAIAILNYGMIAAR